MKESRTVFLALGLVLLGVVDWCPRSSFNDTFLFPSSTVPQRTRSYILVLGDPSSTFKSSSSGHHSQHRHLLPLPSTKAPKKVTDYEDEDYDLEELDEEDEDPDDTEDLFNNLHKLASSTSTAAPPSFDTNNAPLSRNKCPTELHGRCSCKNQIDPRDKGRHIFVVNCTRAGFTDAEFLKYIPDQTEVLIARGNKMPILPKNIFGQGRNFTKLKEIDLSLNEIEEVHGKTFHGVSTVEILILSQNKIDVSSILGHPRLLSSFRNLLSLHLDSAFAQESSSSSEHLLPALIELFDQSNLTLLNKLHLGGNAIERIPNENTFCSLPSLQQLYLGDNRLTDLFLNTSCVSRGLYYIDLSSNRIKVVRSPSFLLDALKKVPRSSDSSALRIDLHDNPFVCDCNLQPFIDWIIEVERTDSDRVRYHEDMRCSTGLPHNNTGRMLMSVQVTTCPSPLSAEANDVMNAVSKGLLGVITFGLLAILLALLLWKGKGLRYLLGPSQIGGTSLLSGGSGVKYTTVEDEEASAEVAHV